MSLLYEQDKYKWFWSQDENDSIWENGGSTIDQCISHIEKNAEPGIVYIAKGRKAKPIINLDRILEDVCESVSEQVGEVATGYCEDVEKIWAYEINSFKINLEYSIYDWLNSKGVRDVYSIDKPVLIYELKDE